MKFQNSKKQGDAGLGSAIQYFTGKGITVAIPLTDSQDYDLVVELDGLKKIQVKTATHVGKSGAFEVALRTMGGNRSGTGKIKLFDNTSVDFLFVLTGDGTRYLVPAGEIKGKTGFSLGLNAEKFRVNG